MKTKIIGGLLTAAGILYCWGLATASDLERYDVSGVLQHLPIGLLMLGAGFALYKIGERIEQVRKIERNKNR